ncbi:Uncharacterised protein [Mycolicibacterium vanbaalenii]|uniref:Uncharacterized protein n=2 Tax=Mycolicibacterium vanbaalenii TaxID=110539 RepID=A0A5S9RBX3_MYCVN|nr:Uncharacterised protein [Mycolicibacterium vanbaalenii]
MVWEKHVGQVGALAVALGIGSAAVAMPGAAWAQTEGSSSASASDSPSGSSRGDTKSAEKPSRSTKSRDAARTPSSTAADSDSSTDSSTDDPESDDNAAESQTETSTSDTEEPTDRRSSSGKRATADSGETEPAVPDADDSPSGASDAGDTATPPTGQGDSSTEARAPLAEPPATDAGDVAQEEPASPTPAPTTVMTSLFAPGADASASDGPEVPGASPLLLTLLASIWRPLGERIAETNTPATVSSAVQSAGDVQASATSSPIPGTAYQSPVIGSDGTLYQVTSGGSTTQVTILDSDGQVVTTSDPIRGVAAPYAHAAMRPDGTLIVVTTTNRRTNTIVSAVDSDGTVRRVATLIGVTDSPLTIGANGALYFRTRIVPFSPLADPIDFRVYRISENGFARSYSYDTDFELTPDGTAHLVSSRLGFSTLRTIDSNGWTRSTFLPFGSDPSAPLLDQDGTAYVTAGVTGFFGAQSTRVYTVDGASRTVRSIAGLPGDTVMTADGFGLETFTFDGDTDEGTGTTYISRITADSIATSGAIDGRIAGFQLGLDGTAYAPIVDPALDDAPVAVAVVDSDGNVTIVTLPGTLVVRDRSVRGGSSQSAEDLGYVNYAVNGTEYVAVLGPDATVVRTVELPEGATGGTVFFGPDGAAYEMVEYRDPSGKYLSRQILALSTDTYTSIVPGVAFPSAADVVFGPNGTGYLVVGTPAAYDIDVLGFNAAGDTVVPPSGVASPALFYPSPGDIEVLTFGADGTAYLVDRSSAGSGVYALTPAGAQKVADLEQSQLGVTNLPTFSADGTGYVANTVRNSDNAFVTTVTVFSPPA